MTVILIAVISIIVILFLVVSGSSDSTLSRYDQVQEGYCLSACQSTTVSRDLRFMTKLYNSKQSVHLQD